MRDPLMNNPTPKYKVGDKVSVARWDSQRLNAQPLGSPAVVDNVTIWDGSNGVPKGVTYSLTGATGTEWTLYEKWVDPWVEPPAEETRPNTSPNLCIDCKYCVITFFNYYCGHPNNINKVTGKVDARCSNVRAFSPNCPLFSDRLPTFDRDHNITQ